MPKLSVIIPSYKRWGSLVGRIVGLTNAMKEADFDDYEIVAINSGADKNEVVSCLGIEDKVKIYNFTERMYPGIARNVGVEKSNFDWIWFVDDDDLVDPEHMKALIELIWKNTEIDVIAHSLKFKYENNIRENLTKNVFSFKEKQEVFNYVFQRNLIAKVSPFSDGVHEDIRYVVQLLLAANNIKVVDSKIYNKIQSEDSITKSFNIQRIDGYIQAIKEILYINDPLIIANTEEIVCQCLGTMLYLINKAENKSDLLGYLLTNFPTYMGLLVKKKYNKKNTSFKYATSIFLYTENKKEMLDKLDYCFRSYLSCKDLKNSIFFGPHEIIGCCKRFFYNGKMKGDIILMPDSKDITLQKILDRKFEVENAINAERFEECEGCPYIERFEKTSEEKVNYISLENYTYCNMKCSYCSPKYYGGREALYDTYGIIADLTKGKHLGKNTHIVWGGGEPTLSPKFAEITQELLDNENVSIVRVLSNSLRYSEDLENFIDHSKIRLVTSIDAGTQSKFKEIRGKGEITKVLNHLKKYKGLMTEQENLTIKYILTEDNYYSSELEEFVRLLKSYGFEENFIQISCNFKLETPTVEMTYAIYELAGRLFNEGFKFVFLDDLIRDRLEINEETEDKIINYLNTKGIYHSNIVGRKSNKKVILWGKGYQSEWIKTDTNFGKAGGIVKIIANDSELTDNDFIEKNVICPSAVQSLPDIYKQIKKSKVLGNTKFYIFL
jgi:glycosyltransferase involved in cell wall biosynthesis/wyosine [tRNA(Phe)-imidazoG37] synthetase (radical SAM superfamily)